MRYIHNSLLNQVLSSAVLAACCSVAASAQQTVARGVHEALPDAPGFVTDASVDGGQASSSAAPAPPAAQAASGDDGKQTKRILGIIPNFRSVSVDVKLPPLSTVEKFKLASEDSFDYSSVIFAAGLAGVSQLQGSYPEFHQGAAGYARYFWHGFTDQTIGNYMTEFIVPTVTREDPRYYTLGRGGFLKRTVYSFGRLAITRNNAGNETPNISEIVGNGAAAGISTLYYPQHYRTWTKTGQKWAYQIGLDGVSNIIKEFWPDINNHLFHMRD